MFTFVETVFYLHAGPTFNELIPLKFLLVAGSYSATICSDCCHSVSPTFSPLRIVAQLRS